MSMEATGTDAQVAEAWRRRAITAEDRVGHLERLLRSAKDDLGDLVPNAAGVPGAWSRAQRTIRRITRALNDDS